MKEKSLRKCLFFLIVSCHISLILDIYPLKEALLGLLQSHAKYQYIIKVHHRSQIFHIPSHSLCHHKFGAQEILQGILSCTPPRVKYLIIPTPKA